MRHRVTILVVLLTLVCSACGGGEEGAGGSEESGRAIGPDGGEVVADDGLVMVSVPSGALGEEDVLSLSPAPSDEWPESLTELAPLVVYRLAPDGLEFEAPARVELTLDVEVDDGSSVVAPLLVLVGSDDSLEAIDATTRIDLDAGTATVSGEVSHFSWLAAVSGALTVGIDKAEPPTRPVGAEWAAYILVDNNGTGSVDVGLVEYLAEGSVGVAGVDTASGFELEPGERMGVPEGGDPTSTEWGVWECAEPGRGFYGVSVSAFGFTGADRFLRTGATVEVLALMDCVAASGDASPENPTGDETPSDNETVEETTTIEVPVTCEQNTGTEFSVVPCVTDGVAMAGTSATLTLVDDTLTVVCGPDCGAPDDWPFHQFMIELWTADDRAILCYDDPDFGCGYADMRTYGLVPPEDDGVEVPEGEVPSDIVALQMTRSRFAEVDGLGDFIRVVIQWWFGDEVEDTDLAVLTVEGDDLERLSEELEEDGEVTVGGLFGQ